ncbi:acyltransferase [Cystobacter fuscus]|uniref:Acyltransferase n=1 Tax=Cystobacter fuscus TaxID=43 RepID=A0A250IVK6_9BACT|nr:lysophospholipid acyltransferase family protein [Cystobacter fuscus]ATB35774.1 acyltransferase [Cystobacter fuscus]
MIHAAKGGFPGWMVDTYVGWKFRSSFRGLWVRGALEDSVAGRLVYANHSNWWDGFVLHQLGRAAGWDTYCVMEEKNLARYRFLSRIGAFSIRRGEAASSLETLRYASSLLARPRAAVCIFPEGELRPHGVRSLKLERGVELLARVSGARCVPLCIRYAFFEHERPDVLVEVGGSHAAAPLERYREELEAAARRLEAATSLEGFTQVVSGARGVAERWDAVRGHG